ncbi:hypothetical protein SAMN05421872_101538 [Nocardioides lianchengensis]|uniref:Uncharacterized protein n=1 Tax=Nocardioides lianchengensis TaxID=1045774 RepID=A0A1G6JNR2_9ACTN|nr:hypothetical protein SAMN05421872_101538 [Nocardioides lianchengensis]
MQSIWSLPAVVEDRPAGAASLDQVAIASGLALVLTVALLAVVLAHRTGRLKALDRLLRRMDGAPLFGGVASWASLPLMVAMVSLITALFGMYWDISLHIGVGRDEGPLANPAHYPILFGLFGISAAGVLACALPREDQVGPSGVQLAPGWRAPAGGVLLTGAGSYALLGFPLDDVWHRIFGQDVTLWGPTHLMLIGGAGLSLVAMAVLLEEGRAAGRRTDRVSVRASYVLGCCLAGGLLIGMSVFQAEYDFGVEQFRLVMQPLMIATAATFSLVVARLWVGRGAAVAAVVFYLVVRGGVSVVVGPVLGELWASVPLYLAEALIVEAVAARWADRPLRVGAVSGALIGTVGFAAEYAWTQVAFTLAWTPDILLEGVLLATLGGVAAGLLAGLLVLGLRRELPVVVRRPRLVFGGALVVLAAIVTNGVLAMAPSGLEASTTVVADEQGPDGREIQAEFRFNEPPVDGAEAWLTVTAWQGGRDSAGLHVQPLEEVSPTLWRTTEPIPVDGTWKTMVRVHDGRSLRAMPIYLPEDSALDEPAVPVADGEVRAFGEEKLILQRELKDDVPGWLWSVAGLVVLACSLVLVLGLGWGVSRYARAPEPGVAAERRTPVGV